MNINWVIDWLAYNAVGTYDLNHQAMAYKPELWAWIETKGTYGYDKAIETSDKARIMWSSTRNDMGTFISYPGRALSAYSGRGVSAIEIMENHRNQNDICRRLDLAFDVIDSGLKITDLYRSLKRGLADTNVKKYNLITGNQGDTLYIGSRESEQFIRIYDKAKEQGDFESDKIRIEIELKGSRAIQMAEYISNATEPEAIRRTQQLINSVVQFKGKEWVEIMSTDAVGLAKAKDEQPDTEKWLLQSVAPAMAKHIRKTGNNALIVRFIRIVTALAADGNIDENQ